MKVVLFCGGNGIKLWQSDHNIPKPLVPVGNRPLIWHTMKYYTHFGHTDFILCLGINGDVIKDYFVKYRDYISNDFVLKAGSAIELYECDISNWNITFVDTGANSNVSERLSKVSQYLDGEEEFLVNYLDGLTDLHLPDMIGQFQRSGKIACLMVTRPTKNLHVTSIVPSNSGRIADVTSLNRLDMWLNSGYYIFRKEIFEHLDTGGDLLDQTFLRLVGLNQLVAYPYDGLFATIDTFKGKQILDDMHDKGDAPWQVWKSNDQHVDRSEPPDQVNFSRGEFR